MHETLIQYIREHSTIPLTEEEIDTIKRIFIPKKFRKRQFFLQEGEVCKYMGFITKGAMKQYNIDAKGAEHILYLTIENWWVGDRESFHQLTPSPYFIDAWEDTEVLVLSHDDAVKHLDDTPAFKDSRNKMDEKHSFALLKRINANISLPAEQRYALLQQTYPEFLQRFPQHIIASYLGITKETLSRVRNNAAKK